MTDCRRAAFAANRSLRSYSRAARSCAYPLVPGLASFGGYAVANLFPLYLIRSHAMTQAEVGVYLGLVLGIAGGLGFAGGGFFADRMGRRGQRVALNAVAIAMLFGWVFMFPVFLSGSRGSRHDAVRRTRGVFEFLPCDHVRPDSGTRTAAHARCGVSA